MSCTLSPWLPPPEMGAKSGSNIKSLWLDVFVFVCSDSLNYLYWGCVIAHAGRHNPQMTGWDGASPIPGTREVVFKLQAPRGPPFKIPNTPGSYMHQSDAVLVGLCQFLAHNRMDQRRRHQPGWGADTSSAQQDARGLWPSFFSCCKNKMWFFWLKQGETSLVHLSQLRKWVKYQTFQLNWLTSSNDAESCCVEAEGRCAGVGCDAKMCWALSSSK